jgi:hypothetical protein
MHRSFATSGELRDNEKRARESALAIRAEIRFWRAAMRREVAAHENFFIAKTCDSESVLSAFERRR